MNESIGTLGSRRTRGGMNKCHFVSMVALVSIVCACDLGQTTVGELPVEPTSREPVFGDCSEWDSNFMIRNGDVVGAAAIALVDDELLVAGSPSSGALARYSRSGEIRWDVELDPSSQVFASAVVASDDGSSVVLAKVDDPTSPSGKRLHAFGVSADGEVQWMECVGQLHHSAAVHTDLRRLASGGYTVSWHGSSGEGSLPSLAQARLGADGTVEWTSHDFLPSGTVVAAQWSQGAMELLPSDTVLQLTAAGEQLRLVESDPIDGSTINDVVLDELGSATPIDLEVLPDGTVWMLVRMFDGSHLIEVTPAGDIVAQRQFDDAPSDAFLHQLTWQENQQRLLLTGEARDERGIARALAMVLTRDWAIDASIFPYDDGGVSSANAVVADPFAGFVVTQAGPSLRLLGIEPTCDAS